MFKNIGGKIKIIAIVVMVLELLGSAIGGGIMTGHGYPQEGPWIIVGGVLLAIISGFVLYGFGELVENSTEIVKYINVIEDRKQNEK